MNYRFDGKTVLVTGAGSGIGRATARAFAAEGARVVVSGRREHPLKETVELITADGGAASLVTGDVTSEDEVRRVVDTVTERHGRLDVAVNNAGVFDGGAIDEFDLARWNTLANINITGVLLAMKHQIRHMKPHGAGAIVNVGSLFGAHKVIPGTSAYGATKAAVSALSKAAALENIQHGIRINVVSPGAMNTTMSMLPGETADERDRRLGADIPLGRVGELDEVTSAIRWLASDESGFAVGHDLVVDGGVSL